jgi:hypothetical protein
LKLYTLCCSRYPRITEVHHEPLAIDCRPTGPTRTATAPHLRRRALSAHFGHPGGGRRAPHRRDRPDAPHQPGERLPLDRVLRAGTRPGILGGPARGQSPQPVGGGTPGRPRRHRPAAAGPLRLPGSRMDRPAAARTPGALARGLPLRDIGPPAVTRPGLRLEATALRARPRPRAREKNAASAGKSRGSRGGG